MDSTWDPPPRRPPGGCRCRTGRRRWTGCRGPAAAQWRGRARPYSARSSICYDYPCSERE